MSGPFRGLPADIGSPREAAVHIAKLTTCEARYEYFDRIPVHWQALVMHEAVQLIAAEIVKIERKADRRLALARVPEDWRKDLCSHVARMWGPHSKAEATA